MAYVCHTHQRHTPSSLAAVIGLSNNDVIVTFLTSLLYVACFACVALDGNPAYHSSMVQRTDSAVKRKLCCRWFLCFKVFQVFKKFAGVFIVA